MFTFYDQLESTLPIATMKLSVVFTVDDVNICICTLIIQFPYMQYWSYTSFIRVAPRVYLFILFEDMSNCHNKEVHIPKYHRSYKGVDNKIVYK